MIRSPDAPLTVAAVVICFNQDRFLAAALEGLRHQTRPPDQVILVDDCSTDGSQATLRAWAAEHRPDAVLVFHEVNQGVTRTLNEAFTLVSCDLVAPLAGDDVWLPGKLQLQLAHFAQLPEQVGVLYGDVDQIDEHGGLLPERFIAANKGRHLHPEGALFLELLQGNFLPSPSLLLRRACWEQVGHFDESLYMEDWDFWLRVAQHYDFAYSPYDVAQYRVVSGSHVSRKGPTVLESHLATLLKWSHTPELRHREVQAIVRSLAGALITEGSSRYRRRRLAWLWVHNGGLGFWVRGRPGYAGRRSRAVRLRLRQARTRTGPPTTPPASPPASPPETDLNVFPR